METTIVSYLTARPTRDILMLSHQQLTQQWWDEQRGHYHLYISPLVIQEARMGDPDAAQRRLEVLGHLDALAPDAAIEGLGEQLRIALGIPERARLDAFHLAYAIYYEVDYLLTWNCAHLAGAHTLRRLTDFARREELWLPVICTPLEMVQ